jgi:hypothetical protein
MDQPRGQHPDAVRHSGDQAVGTHGDDEPFRVALGFRGRAALDLVRSLRGTHHLPIGGMLAKASPRPARKSPPVTAVHDQPLGAAGS